MSTSASQSRWSRLLTVAMAIGAAVLAPVEFAAGEELVRPEMLVLLSVSCGGLALALWVRVRRPA